MLLVMLLVVVVSRRGEVGIFFLTETFILEGPAFQCWDVQPMGATKTQTIYD